MKGSLIVIKWCLRHVKLYVLEGSTINGNVIVTTSLLNVENIALCHMFLDYMNENSLAKLSKKELIYGQIGEFKFMSTT